MRAAVLHQFKQPLRLEEVPRPTCGPDDVLLQVEACGVCHTDLHLADGDWAIFNPYLKLPLILGHEVVGRVVEKGAAVSHLAVGDRAGVPWIHSTCGQCEFCRDGRENLCQRQTITGGTVNGGYAQFMKARASHALKVPAALPPHEAAPLFCAGLTVYRACRNAEIKSSQRVAVFGIGGLGHLAVQLARHLGAEVIAVDVAAGKLELARSLGAAHAFSAEAAVKELQALGGVHVALVTAASPAAYHAALQSLRPAGALVVVGLPGEDIAVSPTLLAHGEYKILCASVGTRDDLRAVLDLAAAGHLRCRVETRPLEQLNSALDDLRRGRVSGRISVTP